MFCAGPNFLSQTKNLTAFMPCPSTGPKVFWVGRSFFIGPKIYLHIVPVTNIFCQKKRWFAFSKIGFCAGTNVFEEALNPVKFLGWLEKFGPAQNILGPVIGQDICEKLVINCRQKVYLNAVFHFYIFFFSRKSSSVCDRRIRRPRILNYWQKSVAHILSVSWCLVTKVRNHSKMPIVHEKSNLDT